MMSSGVRGIELQGLLALLGRIAEPPQPDQSGGAVAPAGGAVGAHRDGPVVEPERLRVVPLLVVLVPDLDHVL